MMFSHPATVHIEILPSSDWREIWRLNVFSDLCTCVHAHTHFCVYAQTGLKLYRQSWAVKMHHLLLSCPFVLLPECYQLILQR